MKSWRVGSTFSCLGVSLVGLFGSTLAGCVSADCPAASQHVDGKCFAPDASHGSGKAAGDGGGKLDSQDSSTRRATQTDAGHADPGAADAGGDNAGSANTGPLDAGTPALPCDGGASVTCWRDFDGDGYAAASAKMMMQCARACATGWTATEPLNGEADCDDGDATTHPGVAEACNGADDDCDSSVDEDASSTCVLDNATSICDQGACKVANCAPDYGNCDAKESNGCEQERNVHDHCGACTTACDARADCAQSGSATSAPACECHAPLIDDGASCAGFGPLAVGYNFVCGIRAGGQVECFGDGSPSPGPSGAFTQIAAGDAYACALQRDNARVIRCWGSNSHGETGGGVVTSPNTLDFVQVVGGKYHACGLLADGTARCWGATGLDRGQASVPAGLEGAFKQLAAGGLHTCGLKRDGSAACWGAGKTQACSSTSCTDWGQSADQPSEHFIQIAAGGLHTCGLRADRSVFCWGVGVTPGTGFAVGQAAPRQGPYLFVSAALTHTCAVTPQHKVECWGTAPTLDASGEVLRVYTAANQVTCELYATGLAKCFGSADGSTTSAPPTLDSMPWLLDL